MPSDDIGIVVVIRRGIEQLLKLAEDRNTEQGHLVCDRALIDLAAAKTASDALVVLAQVNRAYEGIEAHGHLTQLEFTVVELLRKTEQEQSGQQCPGP